MTIKWEISLQLASVVTSVILSFPNTLPLRNLTFVHGKSEKGPKSLYLVYGIVLVEPIVWYARFVFPFLTGTPLAAYHCYESLSTVMAFLLDLPQPH